MFGSKTFFASRCGYPTLNQRHILVDDGHIFTWCVIILFEMSVRIDGCGRYLGIAAFGFGNLAGGAQFWQKRASVRCKVCG
jgi:hypothetical protein